MQKRLIFIFLIISFNFIYISGQTPPLKFKEIPEFENISSQFTTCLLQDKSGFIWIGTTDGLNRYDGNKIKIFKKGSFQYSNLSNNHIRTLLCDQKNRIWVGTQSGLSLYTPDFDRFKKLSEFENYSDLATTEITNFLEKNDGNIIISTNQAVFEFDEKSTSFRKIIEFKKGTITSMDLVNNTLWVGLNSENSLKSFSLKDDYALIPLPKWIKKHLHKNQNLTVSKILLHQNSLWIGTNGYGIIRFDLKKKQASSYLDASNESFIVFLDNDKSGNIWTCSYSGLKVFNSTENRFDNYYIDSESNSSIKRNPIGILEDHQGSYWVNYADKGVGFAPEPIGFNVFNKKSYWPLHSNHITAICEDSNGNLWSGSYNGGISVFRWGKDSISVYKSFPTDPYSLGQGTVFDIIKDKKNNIWIGTNQGGLQRFVPHENRFISYLHNPRDAQSINGNDIRSIAEDSAGNLWVAIHGKGVDYYDKNTEEFLHFTPNNSKLSSEWVNQVFCDSQNNLWVATAYGLNKYTTKTQDFEVFLKSPLHPKSNNIKSNEINSIHETPEGKIWIGTPNGLQYYNDIDNNFSDSKSDILNKSFICDIANDSNGYLWISTHSGLYRYTSQTGRTINFDSNDGLTTNNFNNRTSFFDGKNYLFFGSPEGLITFDPGKIKINQSPPRIVLSDLKLFNRSFTKYGEELPLKRHINEASKISLNHEDKFFSIKYNAVNFLNPEKNQYAYKLEGFEDQWNYVENKREAIYTNINPGKYTFKVKASNNKGIWNNEGRSIEIFIKPPWYKSTWFRIIVIAGFAITAILTFHLRTSILRNQKDALTEQVKERTKKLNEKNKILKSRTHELNIKNDQLLKQKQTIEIQSHELREQANQLKENNKNLQNLNNTKDRLFSIIAHDVRSPFNTIIGFSSLLQEMAKENNTTLVAEYAKYINDSSYQIMALLENLLYWARSQTNEITPRFGQTSTHRIFEDTLSLINESIIKKNLSLDVSELNHSIEFIGDEEMLRTVVRNLISNAVKFTPTKGKISVSSKCMDHHLEIKIKDTGIGMTKEQIEQLKSNNLTITRGTHGEKGSGLGLTITKEFIEQHKGEFLIESTPGKGSTFGFRIPLNPLRKRSSKT